MGITLSVSGYIIFCYLQYCIVRNLNKQVAFWEMMMPILNIYRIIEVSGIKLDNYLTMMITLPVISAVAGILTKDPAFVLLSSGIAMIMNAYLLGRIAKKMERSFTLIFVLALIPFVNFSAYFMLAFSKKKNGNVVVRP